MSRVTAFRNNSRRTKARVENLELNQIGHIFELHMKFGFAAICVIFLFIGAPMGAIVRKGGYGYPLLVAIVFFTVFIILTIMFDKLSETRMVDPVWAAWAPCLFMTPIGAILTYKAMHDSKILSAGPFLTKLFSKKDDGPVGPDSDKAASSDVEGSGLMHYASSKRSSRSPSTSRRRLRQYSTSSFARLRCLDRSSRPMLSP